MESASLAEIKKELQQLPPQELIEVCLRLVKFKKVNKELAHYLLFESANELAYVEKAKQDISRRFEEMPQNSLFFTTKYIRKTLRLCKQYAQYSKFTESSVALHIHFCKELIACKSYWKGYVALENFYARIHAHILKDIKKLHEDLQYDYTKELMGLEE